MRAAIRVDVHTTLIPVVTAIARARTDYDDHSNRWLSKGRLLRRSFATARCAVALDGILCFCEELHVVHVSTRNAYTTGEVPW